MAMKCGNKKERGECFFKPSNFKDWFNDNQWFSFLLTVILDNSEFKYISDSKNIIHKESVLTAFILLFI